MPAYHIGCFYTSNGCLKILTVFFKSILRCYSIISGTRHCICKSDLHSMQSWKFKSIVPARSCAEGLREEGLTPQEAGESSTRVPRDARACWVSRIHSAASHSRNSPVTRAHQHNPVRLNSLLGTKRPSFFSTWTPRDEPWGTDPMPRTTSFNSIPATLLCVFMPSKV